jgi:hypothetical protein
MPSKQILIVVALVAVCLWSVVMTALGQLTAVVTLVPSLGLLVQQIAAAVGSTEPRPALDRQPAGTGGDRSGDDTAPAGEEHTR